jgi:hypothetical protein
MTKSEEFHWLIRAREGNIIASNEFRDRMTDYLRKLPFAKRHAALEALSTHADEGVRQAALEFQVLQRHEELSKNFDYVRRNSPLQSGARLELFGGYDYYSSEGKPWWLNGRAFYKATFLGFASYGESTIPAGLVEFDEVIEVPGHKGRYGVLLATYGLHSFAWGQTEGVAEVYVTQALPEDLTTIRNHRASASAIETHATYRVEERQSSATALSQ